MLTLEKGGYINPFTDRDGASKKMLEGFWRFDPKRDGYKEIVKKIKRGYVGSIHKYDVYISRNL